MISCHKDCENCESLNVRTDDKGYPWAYECLKYGDSVFRDKFGYDKDFPNYRPNKINNVFSGLH